MGAAIRTDKWADGSYFEASLPESWTYKRDHKVKGWPYCFTSETGARLDIYVHGHPKMSGPGSGIERAPSHLTATQKLAYLMTLRDAEGLAKYSRDTSWSFKESQGMVDNGLSRVVRMHSIGTFIGFSYEIDSSTGDAWNGYFCCGSPWMLHAVFSAPKETFPATSAAAFQILESLRILPLNDTADTAARKSGARGSP